MLIFILGIILLFLSFILFWKAKQIKVQKDNKINQIQQQIKQRESQLQTLQQNIHDYQIYINDQKKDLNNLLNQKFELTQDIQKKTQGLNSYYNNLKNQINSSFEQYVDTIDKSYQTKEKQFLSKINKIQKVRAQVENQLDQIKSVYQAVTAARIRQQEEQDKKIFYQLQIPKKQISDIAKLEKWKQDLNDPSIVAKIIWSSYIMKATSNMCNRIVGSSNTCGIYKITNILTGDIYIGQSVNISDRFKQHIKCGLGIDAPSTNKLYNNMQEYGVWNFTFEILEKCSRDKLNEKERFWIEMYQSNKVGMNITKGNK